MLIHLLNIIVKRKCRILNSSSQSKSRRDEGGGTREREALYPQKAKAIREHFLKEATIYHPDEELIWITLQREENNLLGDFTAFTNVVHLKQVVWKCIIWMTKFSASRCENALFSEWVFFQLITFFLFVSLPP